MRCLHRHVCWQVVYVTATLPYLLLAVILIKGLTLPGAVDGILFYIRPDFNKLANVQVVENYRAIPNV